MGIPDVINVHKHNNDKQIPSKSDISESDQIKSPKFNFLILKRPFENFSLVAWLLYSTTYIKDGKALP